MNEKIFETLSPTRLFVKCSIPSIISTLFISIYTVVDGMFVGNFLGSDALAAVNLVMPVVMISFALADTVAIGASVQVAIKLGEKDEKTAGRIFSFSCLLIIGISAIIGVLGLLLAEPVIGVMGAEKNIMLLAAKYMKVYALFSPVIMVAFALDNFLRICGKINYSLVINISMSLVNIFLDWLFIYKLGWGVESAALASCIGLSLSTVSGSIPFLRKKVSLRISKPSISLYTLIKIISNGSSEFFSNISTSVVMVVVNIVILRIAGITAVAAFSIVMYIDFVLVAIIFSISDAMQPAISYNYGANDIKRVYSIEKRIILFEFIISAMAFGFVILGGEILVSVFSQKHDTALRVLALKGIRIFCISYLFTWFPIVTSSFFTALDRPITSFILSISNTLVFPIISLSILVPCIGLNGVWMMRTLAGILSSIFCIIFFILLIRENTDAGKPFSEQPKIEKNRNFF